MRQAPKVYVAGPLGFAVATRAFYAETLLPALAATGAHLLDPWQAAAPLFADALARPSPEMRTESLRVANRAAGSQNEGMIRSCEAVFAVLDGADVDSGTASEVGFAAALGKTVIGWRGDLRQTGDNAETLVNLQVEHFIRLNGGSLHTDLAGAVSALMGCLSGDAGP